MNIIEEIVIAWQKEQAKARRDECRECKYYQPASIATPTIFTCCTTQLEVCPILPEELLTALKESRK